MADIVATPKAHGHTDHHDVDYLHDGSLLSWLTTVDHKKLGVMYLWSVLFMFFLGGVFALLVRLELFAPGQTIMDAETYNKVFTLHGAIMVFLFIIPSIPAALGNFALPIMLGAKDVAFPRLNLASFWIYVTGALIAVTAMITGGVDTGWTFYTPYSTTTDGSVALMTFAAFVLGFSSILTGVNFIATVHKLRAPGMSWFKMPLFIWGMYATAIIQVLATPVLAITLLLLIAERTFGVGVFDPKLGGDPVLFQHFFWFYSHPAVYIMILPGMAVISEVIPPFSQKTIFGYKAIAFSSVAIAIVSFVVWGHHMFTSGQSQLAGAIFSFLTFLVGIPSAIKVFNWITTLYKGSIALNAPMIYALMFLILFGIGGLTGIFLGAMSVDIHLHDTYFVVAHFHYVMMGSTAIAFLAGLHFWWPKMFGRMYNESAARVAAVLVFIGFNTTFLPQFLLGSRGMPRRYYNYLPEFTFLHQVSTIGSWILGLGFVIMAGYLFASLRKKMDAPANPWNARTLDWQISSPPITHNFHEIPVVKSDPYDYYRPFEPSVKEHH
jgi:cytochrome c oxidase subunit I